MLWHLHFLEMLPFYWIMAGEMITAEIVIEFDDN